jgi:hypothetical protein
MFTKLLNWLKTSGAQMAVNSLPLAEPYLVEQIKKAEGKIGETPEAQAHFLVLHLQDYLKTKLNLK